jgi:ABC-2 type transport system permease protein
MKHLLFTAKRKLLYRLLMRKGFEHWAKVIVAFVVVGLFFTVIFLMFNKVFGFLLDQRDIGPVMIDRLIAIGFLAFFSMLVISNIISSISTLFRSVEANYLMSTPLAHSQVFWSRFVDNFFYSSWATAVIGLPMVLSYVIVHKMPIWQAFGAGILLFSYLLIPAYIGAVVSMLLLLLAKAITMRKTIIIMALAVIGISVFYVRSNLAGSIMFNVRGDLNFLNYYFRQLGSYKFPFLPHVWFAEALRSIRLGMWETAAIYTSALLSTAFFGAFITDAIARWMYFPSFEAAMMTSTRRSAKIRSIFNSKLWSFFSTFNIDLRALLIKDIKLFIRDTSQWSQFGVLLVLLAVYLANLRYVPSRVDSLFWKTVISFANFAFCGYILATLSVRFVYPAISMEGKSFWSISSSPIDVKMLFWEKFILSFIVFFVLAEMIAVISNGLLAQSAGMMLLTAVGIFMMSIALVSLNLGIGVLFPNFEELNPMRIASSGGGMIAALLSMIYVGIIVVIAAIPTYHYATYLSTGGKIPRYEIIFAIAAVTIVNLATTIIPIKLGLKVIGKKEF